MIAQKIHELKTDPAVFDAVARGVKTHEIRFDDRAFAVGDLLYLRETVDTGWTMANTSAPLSFTGRQALREISHIQRGYGLVDGWCILSFANTHSGVLTPEQAHANHLALVAAYQSTESLAAAVRVVGAIGQMNRSTGMRCVTCCARAGEPHLQSCPERP